MLIALLQKPFPKAIPGGEYRNGIPYFLFAGKMRAVQITRYPAAFYH